MEPLSIPQILVQTTRVPVKKSPKLWFLLVATSLATTSLLYTINLYVLFHDVRPLLGLLLRDIPVAEKPGDGSESDATMEVILNDATNGLMGIMREFPYLVISYLVSVCSWIIFVHFTAVVHVGKKLTSKELLLRGFASLVTYLFATFLIFVYVLVLTLLSPFLLVPLFLTSRPLFVLSLVLLAILALVSVVFNSFLSVVAFVFSVLEGCYGPAAFAKVWEIVKERKVHAFLLTFLLLMVATVTLGSLHSIEMMMLKKGSLGWAVAVEYVGVNVMGLLTIFLIMALTVFYVDCRRCFGERTSSVWVELEFNKSISEEGEKLIP